MQDLAYLQTPAKQTALLKAEFTDFIVKEQLGYEMSGDGEFVAVKIRKTNANTLFVGEKLAQFCQVPVRNMSYAGLKDRHAVTDQWYSIQMPGKETPDFSQFELEGIEVLEVTRHNRKIRIGSLAGNDFEILLRNAVETDELKVRLENLKLFGFPNYFTEQRFGRDGNNLIQAIRWAKGEISVKDRKKRSFYLSAARSEIFNLVLSNRIEMGLIHQVMPNDILQLAGSHSWFVADESQQLASLQQRLEQEDLQLTAPLIGEKNPPAYQLENQLISQYAELQALMQKERINAARRPMLIKPRQFSWQFESQGLRLNFYLPAGSYATALIRELVQISEISNSTNS